VREGTKTLDKNKRMPQPHKEAAAAAGDDKSQNAAGSQAAADNKGEGKGTNPSNGQSIAQVAGAEKPKADEGAGKKADDDDKGDDQRQVIKSLTKENRELKKMIRDEVIPTIKSLQEQVKNEGTSAKEAKDELEAIAEKWELKPEFVKELSGILLNKSKKQFEDEYLSDIKDIKDIKAKTEQQSKQVTNAQITAAISKEFDRVVAENPALAKVAKKEAVKKYIMSDEDNLGRSMEEIIDELYGDDKESAGIEGYSSQGGNHPKDPDYTSPSEEDHKRIAESREKGGKEFSSYQEGLIDRLTHRSRHRK